MVDSLHMLLLGMLQGATEFLPVSSSGHLAVGQLLFAMDPLGDHPMLLEILLHMATVAAVVLFYRHTIVDLLKVMAHLPRRLRHQSFAQVWTGDADVRLLGMLVIGTLPTGAIGMAMEKSGVAYLASTTPVILGTSFLLCAAVLWISRFAPPADKDLTWRCAVVVGIAQGLAVMPGISRSGMTIAVAMFMGIDRNTAARFSFLLSIPAILGAAMLKLDADVVSRIDHFPSIVLGVLGAFGVGLGALVFLIRMVRRGQLWIFAPYVGLVGIGVIAFF